MTTMDRKISLKGNQWRLEECAKLVFSVAWKKSMWNSKAKTPMDLYAAGVNKFFIMFVCMCLKETCIA
jgi:hypothetical protein